MQGYELGEKIDKGAMGDVYEGRHVGLNRAVAIKVLKPSLADDEEFVKRFLEEARLCALFDHPHIVRVYDVGRNANGTPCLVMERLHGETLKKRLERGPLSEDDAVAIAHAILRALECAHAQNIVHRDMKPGNVFLSNQGVKVMDFGIAKALNQSGLTSTGVLMGTPAYMSPEQAEGRSLDTRSDLYGVGILLYEMLTGDVPFKADTQLSVLHMHIYAPLPPLPNTVSPWLREIVVRALAKKPEDRYASTAEMRLALERGPQKSPLEPPESHPKTHTSEAGGASVYLPVVTPIAWAKWALGGVIALLTMGLLFTQANKKPDVASAPPGVTVPAIHPVDKVTIPSDKAAADMTSSAQVPVSAASATGSLPQPPPGSSATDSAKAADLKVAADALRAAHTDAVALAQRAKERLDDAGERIKYYLKNGGDQSIVLQASKSLCVQALSFSKEAVAKEPNNREAWRQQIRALGMLERPSEKKEAVWQAIRQFPGDAELVKQRL